MTNTVNTFVQDILFEKFTGYLVKKIYLTIFQVVIKVTIEVMVGYDPWLIRTNNGTYDISI